MWTRGAIEPNASSEGIIPYPKEHIARPKILPRRIFSSSTTGLGNNRSNSYNKRYSRQHIRQRTGYHLTRLSLDRGDIRTKKRGIHYAGLEDKCTMKATTWLCPVLTLLCAAKLVYTAQRGSYGGFQLDNMDSQMLQNDYFASKRNKPSLSIVNPLDVLRQRLLLEIARRQMKENSRQVELNRAILRNVGKRMDSKYQTPLSEAIYDMRESQQQQQQQQHHHQQQQPMQDLQTYEYELIPAALIFDYLQQQQQQQQQQQRRPWLPHESTAIQFDNNYINDVNAESAFASPHANNYDADESGVENLEQDIIALNGVAGNKDKHTIKYMKQSNNVHSSTPRNEPREMSAFQKSINNRDDDTKRYTVINKNHQLHQHKNDLNLDLNDENPVSSKPNTNANANANANENELTDNGDDYQVQRYLYHLHNNQNHLTRN